MGKEDKREQAAAASPEINADDLMAKYDKESAYRRLDGWPAKLVFLICVLWSGVPVYTPESAASGCRHVSGLSFISCQRKGR